MQTENFSQLAVAWKTEMSDKLMKTEIGHDVRNGFNTDKSILNPTLVMNERHKMERYETRIHHIKFFPLPKESVFVEANKLIRKENAEILLQVKEEQLIKRAIHSLEKNFAECRNSAEQSLRELERLSKRKGNSFVRKSTYKFENSKQIDSQDFLKNVHRIYKNVYYRSTNIQCRCENSLRLRDLEQCENEVKSLEKKSLSRECQILPDGKVIVKVNDESDGKELISSEYGENELGPCECNDERSKLYPSPKDMPSNRNSEVETALQNLVNLRENINSNFSYRFTLSRYWKAWRKFVLRTRIDKEKLMRINKIDMFLERLTKTVSDNVTETKILNLCEVKNANVTVKKRGRKKRINPGSVDEKDKQLEKIEHDLNKSAVESYENLQRGLKKFHPRLQPKVKALSVFPKVEKKFSKTQTRKHYPVPSFLIRMENRYKEREQRWENIKRRKREIEEEKEQIEREREEERMKMEEMRKREKFEELAKKRMARKKVEEEREMRKQVLKEQIKVAQDHYIKYLTKRIGFEPWKRMITMRYDQLQKAVSYSQMRTEKLHLKHWRNYTQLKINQKCQRADKMYNFTLLKRSFTLLIKEYNDTVKKLQVALDWWDAKFTEKLFKLWVRFTRRERRDYILKEEIAYSNFKRVITTKYFKIWKRFPEYMRNEKQKEVRKRLLQRKVQEFLPDYQPSYEFEI